MIALWLVMLMGFRDIASEAGIRWRHFNGMSADRYLVESTTGGVAVFDFDGDGRMDLLFVNGGETPRGKSAAGPVRHGLYRNLGGNKFADVTAKSGLGVTRFYGMGAAAADYDNDGFADVYVSGYPAGALFRNNGDGTFADVSAASGVAAVPGRALGVVAIDYDEDGWQDLFVARDASPNLLLKNKGDGTFADVALEAEMAFNADGVARAGMGVDAGDVDGDGRADFVVTNFDTEYHALYLNAGRLPFREATVASRLAQLTKPYVGWGVRMVDYDNDGDLDLLIVNGHLHEMIAQSNRAVSYREPPLLLANDGKARFTKVDGGPVFAGAYLGRGMATGDLDNDGFVDAVFVSVNDPPVVLHNEARGGSWVGVRLRGTVSNRDAIGARLTLRAGGRVWTRWITGGGSFLASHDRRVVFGGAGEGSTLEIRWPSGRVQSVSGLSAGRYQEIVEAKE